MVLLARASGSIFLLSVNNCSKFILNYSKIQLYKKRFSELFLFNKYLNSIHFLHTDLSSNKRKEFKNFMYDDLVAYRRLQARRSILIEVQSYKSCIDVYKYCSEFGHIKNMFYYTDLKNIRYFVFIEFEHEEYVDKILSISTHLNSEQIIPVQSSNLWFRKIFNEQNNNKTSIDFENSFEFIHHSCTLLNDSEIIKILEKITVSQQILSLYKATKLSDSGIRLRFYTAYQFERSFHGLFPNIAVLPFGSSVNGFGTQNCDLDLTLRFGKENVEKNNSRLVFHTKHLSTNDKHRVKNLMSVLADMINIFIPGVYNMKKILEARVPIIRFDHQLTGIECDLSITNMSGYYMSELLYVYGKMDRRVGPLVFTIRKWAKNCSLTKDVAGPWITNFSLTLMVLFFFQTKEILPTLDVLKLCATQNDIRLIDCHVDCTFQRDITKIPKTQFLNKETLEELLLEFFYYYSKFDFERNAISLRKGKPILKPDHSALYICNPLQTSLNVSKNIKYEETQRIQYEMRNAVSIMQRNKFKNLGLINLLFNKNNNNRQNTNSVNIEANNNRRNTNSVNIEANNNRRNTNSVNIEAILKNSDSLV